MFAFLSRCTLIAVLVLSGSILDYIIVIFLNFLISSKVRVDLPFSLWAFICGLILLGPDFCYDPTTCHPQNMVTSDSRTLKNVRGRTANIGTALKNYRGAIATKPFSKTGRFYFEVVVYFFIKRQLRNDLIFEVLFQNT